MNNSFISDTEAKTEDHMAYEKINLVSKRE